MNFRAASNYTIQWGIIFFILTFFSITTLLFHDRTERGIAQTDPSLLKCLLQPLEENSQLYLSELPQNKTITDLLEKIKNIQESTGNKNPHYQNLSNYFYAKTLRQVRKNEISQVVTQNLGLFRKVETSYSYLKLTDPYQDQIKTIRSHIDSMNEFSIKEITPALEFIEALPPPVIRKDKKIFKDHLSDFKRNLRTQNKAGAKDSLSSIEDLIAQERELTQIQLGENINEYLSVRSSLESLRFEKEIGKISFKIGKLSERLSEANKLKKSLETSKPKKEILEFIQPKNKILENKIKKGNKKDLNEAIDKEIEIIENQLSFQTKKLNDKFPFDDLIGLKDRSPEKFKKRINRYKNLSDSKFAKTSNQILDELSAQSTWKTDSPILYKGWDNPDTLEIKKYTQSLPDAHEALWKKNLKLQKKARRQIIMYKLSPAAFEEVFFYVLKVTPGLKKLRNFELVQKMERSDFRAFLRMTQDFGAIAAEYGKFNSLQRALDNGVSPKEILEIIEEFDLDFFITAARTEDFATQWDTIYKYAKEHDHPKLDLMTKANEEKKHLPPFKLFSPPNSTGLFLSGVAALTTSTGVGYAVSKTEKYIRIKLENGEEIVLTRKEIEQLDLTYEEILKGIESGELIEAIKNGDFEGDEDLKEEFIEKIQHLKLQIDSIRRFEKTTINQEKQQTHENH